MSISPLLDVVLAVLKTDTRLVSEDEELLKNKIQELAYSTDPSLISVLLKNPLTKERFFREIEGCLIFAQDAFVSFVMSKEFLPDSYTKYKNKIGLNIDGKTLEERKEVSLVWAYKDCVLAGGQDKEDAKRDEIFYNETLGSDQIDRLLDPKVFTEFKRIDKDGKHDLESFRKDENGNIKDNLVIKGNNLLTLHSLKKKFKGKVKLIYIDPPYNTGNDGFRYNDRFNHSSWLTFMRNRLEISLEFLTDDGVIFVQCDDNEQAYLKILMDNIFGRENFLTTITIESDARVRHYEALSRTHEFICVYAKTGNYNLFQKLDNNKKFSFQDEQGGFDLYELRNRNIAFNSGNRPNLFYPFFINLNSKDKNGLYEISLDPKEGFIEVLPLKSKGVQTVWRWGKETASKNINSVLFGKESSSGFQIVKKYREKTSPFSTVWSDKEILVDRATLHLKALFNEKRFDFPKPEEFIKRIMELSTQEGDLVLDFFGGSGTTGAVAHKMGRQYILAEQMDYIHDLPEARLIKVIEGEKGGISESVGWGGGGDFVYMEIACDAERYIEMIRDAVTTEMLMEIWGELKTKSFVNYKLDPQSIDNTLDAFRTLTLEVQKRILIDTIDKNALYKNLSEMDDANSGVSEEDKKLNRNFYNS